MHVPVHVHVAADVVATSRPLLGMSIGRMQYTAFPAATSWYGASDKCTRNGGRLALPATAAKSRALAALLNTTLPLTWDGQPGRVWVGMQEALAVRGRLQTGVHSYGAYDACMQQFAFFLFPACTVPCYIKAS